MSMAEITSSGEKQSGGHGDWSSLPAPVARHSIPLPSCGVRFQSMRQPLS